MKIVYLKPRSGFITDLRSDTLWGTICWGIRIVYGNKVLEDTLESFNNDKPEFLVSSTFPFLIIEGKQKLFFPKPCLPLNPFEKKSKNLTNKEKLEANVREKKNKKKEFIDYESFIKLANKEILIDNALFYENSPQITSTSITHNTIDRIKGATLIKDGVGQLFHIDEYSVETDLKEGKNETGLFFLIKGDTTKVEGALRWLSHVGIGRDRNTGKGHFEITVKEFEINEPVDYNAITTLSLYYPSQKNGELNFYKHNPLLNYQIEQRHGYMGFLKYKNFEKPVTIMFKEGSVFPAMPGKEVYGENLIVKEKDIISGLLHNVYQYGYGFFVKMKI